MPSSIAKARVGEGGPNAALDCLQIAGSGQFVARDSASGASTLSEAILSPLFAFFAEAFASIAFTVDGNRAPEIIFSEIEAFMSK